MHQKPAKIKFTSFYTMKIAFTYCVEFPDHNPSWDKFRRRLAKVVQAKLTQHRYFVQQQFAV